MKTLSHKLSSAVIATLLGMLVLPIETIIAQPPPKDPEHYLPGLGDFMSSLQTRHAKLWFSGSQENWPLAQYELNGVKEALADMAILKPRFKGEAIGTVLTQITAQPLQALEEAVANKDSGRFSNAYDSLSQACNSCHTSHENGFIVIQRPSTAPVTNQRYAP